MLRKVNYKFLFVTALAFGLINSVDIQLPSSNLGGRLDISNEALAKGSRSSSSSSSSSSRSSSSSSSSSSVRTSSPSTSGSSGSSSSSSSSAPKTSSPASSSSNYRSGGSTGGRASGGSFKAPTSPSNPVGSNTRKTGEASSSQTHTPSSITPEPVYVPRHVEVDIDIEAPTQTVPNPSTAGSTTNTAESLSNSVSSTSAADSSDDFLEALIGGLLLLSIAASMTFLVYLILKRRKAGSSTRERDNNIVTVSKLQVALLATTKGLQSELSELTLAADTQTSQGLLQLLQDSALVLLRNSQNWTHVLASSQSVQSREEAEVLFKKLSIDKRSKFSAETLTNVSGKVNRKQAIAPDLYDGSADYIVVTLLVGTADDKPLFGEIRSAEALKDALQRVASVQSDYLMTFELLWSPQRDTDGLTYEQLLTEYTDMLQIV